ncbi:efflux RND transporter permease subunit [Methylomarinum sp. Ch1-1]|uniref:Efflux RND transporter permease subunit n=1 Tax=Methylomarinum roseum TaxID=3067653 RepID=A0AAU7NUS5_9GAMM|nr:efflux RND transporter permease subunit [Methylomarinum sp. Ch1-1]MDP4519519.1 efflux RND transporter permease subunit [Methylomarinum sp. Ch1-1]
MIAQLIDWSLKNRLFVLVGATLLLFWGAYETQRMPIDVLPDLTAPTVTVISEAHGMAPTEVERLITFPIETALNGAAGVRRVRSNTGIGLAVVIVEFDWGTDIYQARQVVAEKLQLARSHLPADIAAPVMAPITSVMGEILFIALESKQHDSLSLKTTADWVVRRRLLAVSGVAEVIPIGGDTKQYQVEVKPERLAAYGLTLNEVIAAVRETNSNASAGFYTASGQEYLIQGIGRVQRLDDIGEAVVAQRQGLPVLVRDVAEIKIGPALKRGTGSHNGHPAVILGVQKQPGVNTLALTERLDAVLADIQKTLPAGMVLDANIFRQADFIAVSVHNLLDALRDGAILVVIILYVFLMSGRATLITLIAIPISMITALLAMKAMGATVNTMTLGGLAIALGALVDDAIIVVENTVRRMRENIRLPETERMATSRLVFNASHEILGSIVFATLIIMLVFVPLFFLSGVEGLLLQPLGMAYIVAIATSLLVAVTITPVLSYFLLPTSGAVREDKEGRLVIWLKQHYTPLLEGSLTRWRSISLMSAAMLLIALVGLLLSGRAFLPEFNEGSLTISAVTLPGTSLQQSDQLAQRVEEIILEQPEVVTTARRTGRAELDPHAQQVFASEIDVSLKMQDRSKAEFLSELRKALTAVPGTAIVIGQPISHRIDHMLSGTRANIAIKLFGQDLNELRRLAEQVKKLTEQVPGAVDVAIDNPADVPFLNVKFNRQALARYGLSIGTVAEAIETAFAGRAVSRVIEDVGSFDLVVRYGTEALEDLQTIRSTLIMTPSGAQLPLHALADIGKTRGPNTISRENAQRKIVVMANVAERDLAGVVQDIQSGIEEQIRFPKGYYVEYGGQFESAEQASKTLFIVGSIVIVGIFLLLFVAFHSAGDALLVMLNLPLALIGGVIGVYCADGILSVASIIGFITLFGIATRNGVMMISHIHHLVQDTGINDLYQAVKLGALERLSPILMTALGTGLALIPLALSGGEPGSEIQAPMAIVILFGLLTSTALNMLVIPALYYRFGSMRKLTNQQDEP